MIKFSDIHWRISILTKAIAEVNTGILQWVPHHIQWLDSQQLLYYITNEYSRDLLILGTHTQWEKTPEPVNIRNIHWGENSSYQMKDSLFLDYIINMYVQVTPP